MWGSGPGSLAGQSWLQLLDVVAVNFEMPGDEHKPSAERRSVSESLLVSTALEQDINLCMRLHMVKAVPDGQLFQHK